MTLSNDVDHMTCDVMSNVHYEHFLGSVAIQSIEKSKVSRKIMPLDLETRLELVKLYYANGESPSATLRAFKRKKLLHNDPFPVSTISRLIVKFETTKSLHDIPSPGRPSKQEDRTTVVEESLSHLQAASPFGHASSRQIERETGIPQRSVVRLLRHLGMYPYHMTLTHGITDDDKPKRMEFAQWIIENESVLPNVLWSDEAYFSMDGTVNRHNCVIWAYQNPKVNLTTKLHSEKVCVWMAFTAEYQLRPYFFESTVNQHNYTNMLREHVIPQLQNKEKMTTAIFQHDGAPPHYSLNARQFLASQFPEERVIGRGYGHPWPPRSPDLSPLDYYLWGTLKARVFHQFRPRNLDELKQRIAEETEKLTAEEMRRAVNNLIHRAQCVINEHGGLIEHLM